MRWPEVDLASSGAGKGCGGLGGHATVHGEFRRGRLPDDQLARTDDVGRDFIGSVGAMPLGSFAVKP